MNSTVKLVAFIFCLVLPAMIGVRLLEPSPYSKPLPAHPMRIESKPNPTVQAISDLWPLIVAEIGALVLMIDAMIRKYSSPRGLPIAIAVMGLLTIGMSSIVYYVVWGHKPGDVETNVATEFCPRCVAESLDNVPPAAGTHNMVGTRFIGDANRCEMCGSVVKMLWICFLFPLIPLGSYRLLPIGEATVIRAAHIGRKTRFDVRHVLMVYAVDAVVIAIFVLILRH